MTRSRGTGGAGQGRSSPLFFRASEVQLNLGQNIWAVLALFMFFPTHISDKKQIMLLSHGETQGTGLHIGSTGGSDSPREGRGVPVDLFCNGAQKMSAASVSLKLPAVHCGVKQAFVDAWFLGLFC